MQTNLYRYTRLGIIKRWDGGSGGVAATPAAKNDFRWCGGYSRCVSIAELLAQSLDVILIPVKSFSFPIASFVFYLFIPSFYSIRKLLIARESRYRRKKTVYLVGIIAVLLDLIKFESVTLFFHFIFGHGYRRVWMQCWSRRLSRVSSSADLSLPGPFPNPRMKPKTESTTRFNNVILIDEQKNKLAFR